MRFCLTGQAEWDYSEDPQTATLFSLHCHLPFSLLPHTAQDRAREMSGWERGVGVGISKSRPNGDREE